jgi:Tfp pilus assembly protein FimV
MENAKSYKKALMGLKKAQVISLMKDAKSVLEMNTTGKSKNQIVEDLMNIHGTGKRPNLFKGKQLLGFGTEGAAHIKLPDREAKVDRKGAREAKEAEAKAKRAGEDANKKASLDKQVEQTKKNIQKMEANLAKTRSKVAGSQAAGVARQKGVKAKFAKRREAIADIKRRLKGASPAKMAELRKELAAVLAATR